MDLDLLHKLETLVKTILGSISRNYKSISVGALLFIAASLAGLFMDPASFSLGIPTYYEEVFYACLDSIDAECSRTGGLHPFNFVLNLVWFAVGFLVFQILGRWKR